MRVDAQQEQSMLGRKEFVVFFLSFVFLKSLLPVTKTREEKGVCVQRRLPADPTLNWALILHRSSFMISEDEDLIKMHKRWSFNVAGNETSVPLQDQAPTGVCVWCATNGGTWPSRNYVVCYPGHRQWQQTVQTSSPPSILRPLNWISKRQDAGELKHSHTHIQEENKKSRLKVCSIVGASSPFFSFSLCSIEFGVGRHEEIVWGET